MAAAQTGDQLRSQEHHNGAPSMKSESEFVEKLGQTNTHATYIGRDEVAKLSEDHRNYLLQRHGTPDLDPVPAYGTADPYNWPQWKVTCLLSSNSIRLYANTSRLVLESHKSYPSRPSCLYGHLYGRINSIGIHRNCRGPGGKPSTSDLSHVSLYCHPWRRPIVLATRGQPLRTPTCFPSIAHL